MTAERAVLVDKLRAVYRHFEYCREGKSCERCNSRADIAADAMREAIVLLSAESRPA